MTQLYKYNKVKPFLALILLQFGVAGMYIISKFALNKGISQHVLIVYRHAIATAVIAPFAIVLDRSPSPLFFLLNFYMLNEMKKLITIILILLTGKIGQS